MMIRSRVVYVEGNRKKKKSQTKWILFVNFSIHDLLVHKNWAHEFGN